MNTKIPHYRRSGRTTIIMAKALVELLETGECYIVDHPTNNSNFPHKYYPDTYTKWMINKFKAMLAGALHDIPHKPLMESFIFSKGAFNHTILVTNKNHGKSITT